MNNLKKKNRFLRRAGLERGAVLMVSLVFLLLLTIVAISAMKTGIFELLMASNEQARVEAFQRAQSISDDIFADPNNIPVFGNVGDRFCSTTATIGANDCVKNDISIDTNLDATGNEEIEYYVQRVGPLYSPPPRLRATSGFSAAAYTSARFEISVDYNGTKDKAGRSQLAQGVLVLLPSGS